MLCNLLTQCPPQVQHVGNKDTIEILEDDICHMLLKMVEIAQNNSLFLENLLVDLHHVKNRLKTLET
jgi:hypothetical protein